MRLLILAVGCLGWSATLATTPSDGRVASARESVAQPDSTTAECVRFASPGRLPAGTPFQTPLLRGLEFRLSASWAIGVGPIAEPALDYLWLVSPPLRTAPHLIVGSGYGISARESALIERPLRFVLTRAAYDAAREAIDSQQSAETTLRQLDQLGAGHLSFVITDYRILAAVTLPDGRRGDAFDWITFTGEACVAKQGQGQ
jgi:hypothetical protein